MCLHIRLGSLSKEILNTHSTLSNIFSFDTVILATRLNSCFSFHLEIEGALLLKPIMFYIKV